MASHPRRGVLKLDALLATLDARPEVADLLRQFRPPNRFASKRFENYEPAHPSQRAAVERLERLALELGPRSSAGTLKGLFSGRRNRSTGGLYMDGGFGVGKTHLLASLWNASADPKGYLSFDELMYFIGIVGPGGAAEAFDGYRLLAVDEWELDDPGNLKMALAFLRGALANRTFVAVTSNTLPLDLGAGRFSQKDFRSEVEELASAFEVLRIEGDDYRHRHYLARPGVQYFTDPRELDSALLNAPEGTLVATFVEFIDALARLHPIRYRSLARRLEWLVLTEVEGIEQLSEALRWVHFIDSAYDAGIRLSATGSVPLETIFPAEGMRGPYAKKLSRCLSRLEEMLGEEGKRAMDREKTS